MPKSTYYIGIDPGKTGAWAVIDGTGAIKLLGMNDDKRTLARSLHDFQLWGGVFACIEKAHAMPGQGSVSMFTFGEEYGVMQGILIAHDISYELVSSNRWQKEVMDVLPAKAPKQVDELASESSARRNANRKALKNATVDFCIRRWPETSDKLQLKKNQGIADALCLALYCLKRH